MMVVDGSLNSYGALDSQSEALCGALMNVQGKAIVWV